MGLLELLMWGVLAVIGLVLLIALIRSSLLIVQHNSVAVVKRMGRHRTVFEAGPHFMLPFGLDKVHRRFSRAGRTLEISLSGDAANGLPVQLTADLVLRGIIDKVAVVALAYEIDDPVTHLHSRAKAVIRELLLPMTLVSVRAESADGQLASRLQVELNNVADDCGYTLLEVRITSVRAEESIHQAVIRGERSAVERTTAEAEAAHQNKLLTDKATAEAEAEDVRAKAQRDRLDEQVKQVVDVIDDLTDGDDGIDHDAAAGIVSGLLYAQTLESLADNPGAQLVLLPPGVNLDGVTLPAHRTAA